MTGAPFPIGFGKTHAWIKKKVLYLESKPKVWKKENNKCGNFERLFQFGTWKNP